jgi:hypothetical protein
MRKAIYLFAFFGLLLACNKSNIDDLPPTNDPIFKIEGHFDGVPFLWAAGEGEMSMQSKQEDFFGVKSFLSSISNGENGLFIRIMDESEENPTEKLKLKAGDTLRLAERGLSPLGILSVGSFSNFDNIDFINWKVNGVDHGSSIVQIFQPGCYNICGEFHFKSDTTKSLTLCNDLYFGYDAKPTILAKVKTFIAGQGMLEIEGEDKDNLSFVEWKIDGNVVSNSSFFFNTNQATVELTAHHNSGATFYRKLIADGFFNGESIEDFSCVIQQSTTQKWNKAVLIEMYNGSNELSSLLEDNFKHRMVIKSVESHGFDSNNKEILKVRADVKAKLKPASGGDAKLLEVEIVFPFVID